MFLTNLRNEETVKIIGNWFRAVNIAVDNDIPLPADKLGIDAWEVMSLASNHPRVNILNSGPGVGGIA